MITIGLKGLIAERLVAALALVGIHRSLAQAEPTWEVHSVWAGDDPRPELHVRGATTESAVWSAVVAGVQTYREALQFDGKDAPDFLPDVWRALVLDPTNSEARNTALAAIVSDARSREWNKVEGFVDCTPYCLMFGQGHQHFVKALGQVAKLDHQLNWAERFSRAATETWTYNEPGVAFRWDPAEDRRYALRADDPSGAIHPRNDSANRLAAIGMLSMAPLPSARETLAPGFTRRARRATFVWPLWECPLGERAIRALWRHPWVLNGVGRRPAGIREVRVAERRNVGKFLVVGPGVRDEASS